MSKITEKGAMELGTVAIGLYAAAVLAMFGINFNIDTNQTDKLGTQGEKISTLVAENVSVRRDIEEMKAYQRWMVERLGGNPDAIVRPKIEVGTTTPSSNQALR